MEKYLESYPAVLDSADVAEILGVTRSTVRVMIRKKLLPAIRVGNLYRIPKDKLINFLEGDVLDGIAQ